jgi:hypothetical protein
MAFLSSNKNTTIRSCSANHLLVATEPHFLVRVQIHQALPVPLACVDGTDAGGSRRRQDSLARSDGAMQFGNIATQSFCKASWFQEIRLRVAGVEEKENKKDVFVLEIELVASSRRQEQLKAHLHINDK